MIPKIILLTLYFISLLIAANQHGKPKEGVHSFPVALVSFCLVMTLLYFSGFFNVFA